MVEAILQELTIRKDYLQDKKIETIYFGGGTPSILSTSQLNQILDTIYKNFVVEAEELTLEANPDDLSKEKLSQLKDSGINRLSIGVQSFDDDILKYLHRSHNAQKAIKSIKNAQNLGFDNISLDLIYAIPGSSVEKLQNDIYQALQLNPQHISVYSLTIEDKTVFGYWYRKNRLIPVDESSNLNQYKLLVDDLIKHGFEHYEVSNFALPGYYSRHNSNYWRNVWYLGIGPGAHSFNGSTRQVNISNNARYIRAITKNGAFSIMEELNKNDLANDLILTSLRTKWGLPLNELFATNFEFSPQQLDFLKKLEAEGFVIQNHNSITLTEKGYLLADEITSKLLWV